MACSIHIYYNPRQNVTVLDLFYLESSCIDLNKLGLFGFKVCTLHNGRMQYVWFVVIYLPIPTNHTEQP